MHTAPQRNLDCRPGPGELNQIYGPNRPIENAMQYGGYSNNLKAWHAIQGPKVEKELVLNEIESDRQGL